MNQIATSVESIHGADDVSNRINILVVEDNADLLRMLCELLNILGYTFRDAQSGEEANDFLSGTDIFDVLLTDITLPGISGIELARMAVKCRPSISVVFTSGYYIEPNAAIDFPFLSLPKPYTLPQLKEVLDKTCSRTEIKESKAQA